jgi:glutathione S-transferase
MKLYYSPGVCSLSAHIALHEADLAFEAIAAPTKTHLLPDGTDYYTINPLGYVPLLELDDGTRLTEGPAIVQYIADQAPDKQLAPANGTLARYQLQAWLSFISTELHKNFSPLFNAATPDAYKEVVKERLNGRLAWVDSQLAGKDYLMGAQFTVADGYLFTVTNWAPRVGVDISGLANIVALRARVAARPGVQAAMRAEGLLA